MRKAANLDHVKAQLELGLMYAEGKGVEKNIKETLKWFIKAAEQGNVNAQNNLGIMYDAAGLYDEAFKWFKKAAEQGLDKAQQILGVMYYNGRGVEKMKRKL